MLRVKRRGISEQHNDILLYTFAEFEIVVVVYIRRRIWNGAHGLVVDAAGVVGRVRSRLGFTAFFVE